MKKEISVISLGFGNVLYLTNQVLDIIRNASCLVLRTEKHPITAWLTATHIRYVSMDHFYDEYDDFDRLHSKMASSLWNMATIQPVVFTVMDALTDTTVIELKKQKPDDGALTVVPSISTSDLYFSLLPEASSSDCVICPASTINNITIDAGSNYLVTEIDDRTMAGMVKLLFSTIFGDEHEIFFFPSQLARLTPPFSIPIYELDRQHDYNETSAIYVSKQPLSKRQIYSLNDLIKLTKKYSDTTNPGSSTECRGNFVNQIHHIISNLTIDSSDSFLQELSHLLCLISIQVANEERFGEIQWNEVSDEAARSLIQQSPKLFSSSGM